MNVVFLDINGVLHPHNSFKRFNYMHTDILQRLSFEHGIDYTKYSSYDICGVYYDWDKEAVYRLRYILDNTNSKIIVSSNLRDSYNKYKMRDLLEIYRLGKYWFCDTPINKDNLKYYLHKAKEIQDTIDKYNIDNYVVLDDMVELIRCFPNNLVCTRNCIQDEDVKRAIKILKK